MTSARARRAYVIAGLLLASSIPLAQWFAMSAGASLSISRGEILWLYWIAPFLVMAVLVTSVVGVFTLVFGQSLGAHHGRDDARAWALAIAVVALGFWGASWIGTRVRMHRLERHAAAVTTDAAAYLAGHRAAPPELGVRGCTELSPRLSGLRATCQRGFAQWDELIYDPMQGEFKGDVTALGAWAYRWD